MPRLSRDDVLMNHAMVAAMRGTCSRAQVGAIFSHEGRVLVSGYNGAPKGMSHCNHACDCGYPGQAGMSSRYHLPECLTLSHCTVSVHAEANAVAFSARHGVTLGGSELHCTHSPCLPCAQLLINAGITKLTFLTPYRLRDGERLLRTAGIEVVAWDQTPLI